MAVTSPLKVLQSGATLSDGFLLKDPNAELDFALRFGAVDWLTATTYEIHDIVRDAANGHYYRSQELHVSGASREADTAKWKKIDPLWLRPGETVSSHEVIVTETTGAEVPALLKVHATKGSSEFSDGQGVTIWLDDGTDGLRYDVTVRVTTSIGRIDDRSFRIKMEER